jgi:hypothetical protein
VTPWEVERLEQHERLACSRRQSRRLMRTLVVVSLTCTVLLIVAMLVLDLREQPTWRAAMATSAVWFLGVVFGWTLKWSFDTWIESA